MEEKIVLTEIDKERKINWAKIVKNMTKMEYYLKFREMGYGLYEAEKLASKAYFENQKEANKILGITNEKLKRKKVFLEK